MTFLRVLTKVEVALRRRSVRRALHKHNGSDAAEARLCRAYDTLVVAEARWLV